MPNAGEDVEKREYTGTHKYIVGGDVSGTATLENSLVVSEETKQTSIT